MPARRVRGRRAFEIGAVLGRTFPIWARNFVPFMILSLVIYSPLLLYTVMVAASGSVSRAFGLISSFLTFLLGLIVTGAIIYGVFCQLRGKPAGIGDSIRVGFARVLPVLGVGILVFLLAALGPLLVVVLILITKELSLIFLFYLSFIPALIVYCTYWVAVPVAVVERPGVVASLRRSRELTRDNRGSIFVVLLVLGLIQAFAGFIVQMMLARSGSLVMALLVPLLVTIALGALTSVANAVGYHDLRVAKEGVGIEELVSVFA